MQKRDLTILVIAIACGLLAFTLMLHFLQKSGRASRPSHVTRVKTSAGTLSIPEDMRALTLSAKGIENIPPQIQVGVYADILGIAQSYAGKMELQTLVQSAQIIGIEKNDKGIQSATLAVSPIAAEVVTRAAAAGKIHLIIRPNSGEKTVFQLGQSGATEIIRGVSREKNARI